MSKARSSLQNSLFSSKAATDMPDLHGTFNPVPIARARCCVACSMDRRNHAAEIQPLRNVRSSAPATVHLACKLLVKAPFKTSDGVADVSATPVDCSGALKQH